MLLAHQGGWDEILMVLVPISVIVALLAIARQRVHRHGPPPDHPSPPRRT